LVFGVGENTKLIPDPKVFLELLGCKISSALAKFVDKPGRFYMPVEQTGSLPGKIKPHILGCLETCQVLSYLARIPIRN
jgi:hypothetical protein